MTDTRDLRTVAITITVNAGPSPVGDDITAHPEAVRIARAVIGSLISECVLAIFVAGPQRVSGYEEIARGPLNVDEFTPRDVFIPALLANTRGVVICYCHASGGAPPSPAELQAAGAVRDAGRLIGIRILDHLIVGPDTVYSFRESDGWVD